MALTAIALCSRALMKIGADPIASFEDGTAEAELAGALYPVLRDGLIASHPWNFATGQTSLARLEAVPVADYAYAYRLPADFLRALSVGAGGSGRGVEYRIAERRLHADADAIVLTYVFRADESAFPPYFDLALIQRLAAEFCIPMTESTSRAEMLARLADMEFRRARLIDAQEETPPRVEDFTLVGVR